jgi:uncharacterized protein YlzI (FlbEa/FlbD family)
MFKTIRVDENLICGNLLSTGYNIETIGNIINSLEIKQVIFNNPATIIIWKDGSKTVVKASGDEFNEEFGFAMAYLKKIFGERNKYLKYIKNAQRPQEKKEQINGQ